MRIDELQALVDDDALGCQLAMHLGVFRCVQWHEIIGHDSAATINHTMLAQCVILQAVRKMDVELLVDLILYVYKVAQMGIIYVEATVVCNTPKVVVGAREDIANTICLETFVIFCFMPQIKSLKLVNS